MEDRLKKNENIKKIRRVINDAKKFNQKINDQIRKTDRYLESSSPTMVDRGTIRVLIEREKANKRQTIIKKNELNYQRAKRQYNKDLHDLMEKIISMKKRYPY